MFDVEVDERTFLLVAVFAFVGALLQSQRCQNHAREDERTFFVAVDVDFFVLDEAAAFFAGVFLAWSEAC